MCMYTLNHGHPISKGGRRGHHFWWLCAYTDVHLPSGRIKLSGLNRARICSSWGLGWGGQSCGNTMGHFGGKGLSLVGRGRKIRGSKEAAVINCLCADWGASGVLNALERPIVHQPQHSIAKYACASAHLHVCILHVCSPLLLEKWA